MRLGHAANRLRTKRRGGPGNENIGPSGDQRRHLVGDVRRCLVMQLLSDEFDLPCIRTPLKRFLISLAEIVVHQQRGDRGTFTEVLNNRITPDLGLSNVVKDVSDGPRKVRRISPERKP